MELANSMWCVDRKGGIGQIDSISGSDAMFRFFKEGKYGELIRVPLADLAQATVAQLPASHGMAPAELEALGYTAAPPTAPARPAAA